MSAIKSYIHDIRFWILLFFVVRLIGITNPPLEIAHNWRQTTVTMVARNFFEIDNNILYPRIDIAGNETGITGMEFPLLNYLIYLMSEILGYQHWYGRLINLIISSIGLFFFFKLIEKYFEKKIAFASSLILLFSIWFSYSRKIMPDTFSTSFIIMGMYYGSNYLDTTHKLKDLILYFFLITIGILSKLPTAYLIIVFFLFLFDKSIRNDRKILFSVVSITAFMGPALWYLYWVPYLVDKYEFWHFFMGKNIMQGMAEIAANIPQTLEKFYDNALKYIGFVLFLFGLIHAFIKRDKILLGIFGLSFIGFLLIIFKAGYTFSHHSYYIVPFVPVMALFSGYGITQIKNKKIVVILLIAIGLEGIFNQQHDFTINKNNHTLLNLENELDKVSNRNDLIIINSGNFPTPMYFAHRKGWVNYNKRIEDKNYIAGLKEKGLVFIVILKKSYEKNTQLEYKVVLENENYCVYKI